MLRASSLGLSLLTPTTRGVLSCLLFNQIRTSPPRKSTRSILLHAVAPISRQSFRADKDEDEISKMDVREVEVCYVGEISNGCILSMSPEVIDPGRSRSQGEDITNTCLKQKLVYREQDAPSSIKVGLLEGLTDKARNKSPVKALRIHGKEYIKYEKLAIAHYIKAAKHHFQNSTADPLPIDPAIQRLDLLRIIGETSSVEIGWESYNALLSMQARGALTKDYKQFVPYQYMHRLARLLASSRPKARVQFLRLLSVLRALHLSGGTVQLYEWNALIDRAGNGLRKVHPGDLETALSIFNDMVAGRAPGSSLNGELGGGGSEHETRNEGSQPKLPTEPDIYTYTSLINIAARMQHGPALGHTVKLLQASGLPPNMITHLSLLKFYADKKMLSGVRSILLRMEEQGWSLNIDGLNLCMWGYGFNGRPDAVLAMYRVLRHNVVPETGEGEILVKESALQLKRNEFVVFGSDIKPNLITYTTVIQVMAYYGDFEATLSAFVDMLSSINEDKGINQDLINDTTELPLYTPTVPIYRAIFLGFSRHAERPHPTPTMQRHKPVNLPAWNLENLQSIYNTFINWPGDFSASVSIIYWIITAFDKTSGGDIHLLRKVWKQLEKKFDRPWFGENNRLRRMRARLFPEE